MKIYLPAGVNPNLTIAVSPGIDFPNSNFCEADGTPIVFRVEFSYAEARVEDALGLYMIDKGHAQASPLILPHGMTA